MVYAAYSRLSSRLMGTMQLESTAKYATSRCCGTLVL